MEGVSRRSVAWPLRAVAYAHPSRMEDHMTECNAMKRPGKPDTGNPFVRFDEGRSGGAALTTTVGSSCQLPLRLLYPGRCAGTKSFVKLPEYSQSNPTCPWLI